MAKRKNGGKRGARRVIRLVLLAGIAFFGGSLVVRAIHVANVRADLAIVRTEARALYEGFDRFYERNERFPGDYHGRAFQTDTLDPLRRRGYYTGYLTSKLLDKRVDAYGSPDDRGINQEFWVEMSLSREPSIRLLVARSDDAPLGGGTWLDGVYIDRGDGLEPLE